MGKEHVLIPAKIAPKDKQIKCCRIKGGSMAPVLQDGSLVAVDLEEREPQADSLFLLNWENKVMARRIKIQDGHMLFCLDNPDRDKFPIDVCTVKNNNSGWNPIIGKVVLGIGRE